LSVQYFITNITTLITMKNKIYIILFLVGCLALQSNVAYSSGAPFINPETGQLAEGVTSVRVWPFRQNEDNHNIMANRVAWLADEAAQRDMTLVVDLFDSSSNNTYANMLTNSTRIDNMISGVIVPNANKNNIYWSLGNEIGGHENPLAFADFYEQKVAAMRAAGALYISFHPVPGSLEHRWGGDTEQAVRRCIEASDDVSPHFYAVGPVANEGNVNPTDFNSLQQYINIAHQLCKPAIIGEFGITGFCHEGYAQRTPENVAGWLEYFNNTLQVDQVSFWQFMKTSTGHLDDQCFTSFTLPCDSGGRGIGNGDHKNSMVGYLGNEPAHPGACTPDGGGGDCPADLNITNYQSSNVHFQAANTITCNAAITSGANVQCDAGTRIRLTDGFHAQLGSNFHAFIDGCEEEPPGGSGTCEVLNNPGFDTDVSGWDPQNCTAFSSGGIANITNIQLGSVPWHAVFNQYGVALQQGKNYTLSMKAQASADRNVILKVFSNNGTYISHTEHLIGLTTAMQEFTFSFIASLNDVAMVQLITGHTADNIQVDYISLLEHDCSSPPQNCDLVTNGSFDSNTNSWSGWGCSYSSVNGVAELTNISVGSAATTGFSQVGLGIQQGKPYTLSFDARADGNRNMDVRVYSAPNTTIVHGPQTVGLTPTMQSYNIPFTANTTSTANIEFFLGVSTTNVYIDNVKLNTTCNNKQDASLAPNVRLYPNPATHTIHVEYELPQSTLANILVFDAFGKLVKNVADVELFAGTQMLNMDVSDLPTGMYFYTLQADEWKATKKFIIAK